jgi:hypothetical protein
MRNIVDDEDGAILRRLAAAVLLQAAKDVQAGRPCNATCRPADGVHFCRRDARRFLNSPWGRHLLDVMGLGQRPGEWCFDWQSNVTNTTAGRR